MRGNKLIKYIDLIFGIPVLIFLSLFKIFETKKDVGKINKILIIKLSALGDTILLIPVIRTLKENYSESKISVVLTEINKSVAERCDYIENIFEFKPEEFIKNPLKLLKFIEKIRKEKFDLVIDADQWLRISALLCFFSKAKIRIGFKTKGQFKHYTFNNVVEHKKNIHEIECFFDLIKPLKVKIRDKSLEFKIKNDEIKKAKDLLESIGIKKNEKFIIIHSEVPQHAFQRQWPIKNFVKLIEKIIKKYNIKILITGTKRTSSFIRLISSDIKENVKYILDTDIGVLSAIISKSTLVVCNNTGLMHLTCAVGVPVIALHGPTDPLKWGPIGENSVVIKSKLSCSPCLYLGFEYGCKTNNCMKSIAVEEVLKYVDKVLSS